MNRVFFKDKVKSKHQLSGNSCEIKFLLQFHGKSKKIMSFCSRITLSKNQTFYLAVRRSQSCTETRALIHARTHNAFAKCEYVSVKKPIQFNLDLFIVCLLAFVVRARTSLPAFERISIILSHKRTEQVCNSSSPSLYNIYFKCCLFHERFLLLLHLLCYWFCVCSLSHFIWCHRYNNSSTY